MAAMPSVEELDVVVRAFYESRGDVVCTSLAATCYTIPLTPTDIYPTIAKASASYHESGRLSLHGVPTALNSAYDALQFKENPDAWLLVDKILQEATYPQTKCSSSTIPHSLCTNQA